MIRDLLNELANLSDEEIKKRMGKIMTEPAKKTNILIPFNPEFEDLSYIDPNNEKEIWSSIFTHDILTQVVDMEDKSFIDAIIRYAELKGVDELILLDEVAIKQVISLGLEEYNKLDHEDPISYIYRTSHEKPSL